MPNKQRHRGRHPEDDRLFSERCLPRLRAGAADLSFLHTRGYAEKAALKLVGDHYQLDARQRMALQRTACSDAALQRRKSHHIEPETLEGAVMAIDGYNLLITVESALSGGILLEGRDGCIRDLASLHGAYHRVEETLPAVSLAGRLLERLHVASILWYFDAPISNSGRMRSLLLETAKEHAWPWRVELLPNPDHFLAACEAVVVSSDSTILDKTERWTNLMPLLIESLRPTPSVLRFF